MLARAYWLAVPLALAVLTEVLFLRLLMRTGAFLPRADQYLDVYRLLMLIGTAAANLACILALAVIGLLGLAAWGRGGAGRVATATAIAAALAQVSLVLAPTTSPAAAVVTLALTAAAMVAALVAARPRGPVLAGLLLLLATYLAALAYAVAQPARGLGLDLPDAMAAYLAAEALAVVAVGGAALLVRPRAAPSALVAGVLVGLLVTAARVFSPWTMGTATIWTVAFSLWLPAPVYGLAAGLAVFLLVADWRGAGRLTPLAAGLVLVFAGGLKLDYGYFALLALAGCLLTISAAQPTPATLPRPVATPALTPAHGARGSDA